MTFLVTSRFVQSECQNFWQKSTSTVVWTLVLIFLKSTTNGKHFFNCIITGDETWIHHYDLESKYQWMQWKNSVPPSSKKSKHSHKPERLCLEHSRTPKALSLNITKTRKPQWEVYNNVTYWKTNWSQWFTKNEDDDCCRMFIHCMTIPMLILLPIQRYTSRNWN